MPDYAPDYTPRYRAQYVSGGIEHHIMVRGFRGESSIITTDRARTALFNVLNPLAAAIPDDFSWLGAEYIPQDTNIGTPDSTPAAITGLAPVAQLSDHDRISSIGWVGRSVATPMRLFFFGVQFSPDLLPANVASDYRLYTTESSVVADSVTALNAAGLPANNNLPGAWKLYINLKVNDYWLKLLRRAAL